MNGKAWAARSLMHEPEGLLVIIGQLGFYYDGVTLYVRLITGRGKRVHA